MRENLTARICLIGLDAEKFSCAKISTFTVTRASSPLCEDRITTSILYYQRIESSGRTMHLLHVTNNVYDNFVFL